MTTCSRKQAAMIVGLLVLIAAIVGVYKWRALSQKSQGMKSPTTTVMAPSAAYPNIVYLNRRPMDGWNTPQKMHCGEYDLKRVAKDAGEVVYLMPQQKALAPASVSVTDMTFDPDCENVYWIQDRGTLHRYNIKAKTTQKIAIPNAIFKSHVLKIEKTTYYPSPTFLYAYGSRHQAPGDVYGGNRLLVSFETPTTGKDGSSNFSIQAVYDGTWKFITDAGGMEPVVLNPEQGILSLPEQINGESVARRHDIYLGSLEDGFIGLAKPFNYHLVCSYGGDEQDPVYQACRQKELDALFTEGHPELNAP